MTHPANLPFRLKTYFGIRQMSVAGRATWDARHAIENRAHDRKGTVDGLFFYCHRDTDRRANELAPLPAIAAAEMQKFETAIANIGGV